jgi:hypothetical protein
MRICVCIYQYIYRGQTTEYYCDGLGQLRHYQRAHVSYRRLPLLQRGHRAHSRRKQDDC